MQVLQSIWVENKLNQGKLHLWMESSALFEANSLRPGKRSRRKEAIPRKHPFTLQPLEIHEFLGNLDQRLILTSAENSAIKLLLPSTKNSPHPSPHLLNTLGLEVPQETPELSQWHIPTLALSPELACPFLLALPMQSPPEVGFAYSVQVWREVAKLSLEFWVRQSFIPSLEVVRNEQKGSNSVYALWEPIYDDKAIERTQILARALPSSCRSYQQDDPGSQESSKPPEPVKIIKSFLAQTVDAFVREVALQSVKAFPLAPLAIETKNKKQTQSLLSRWQAGLSLADSLIKLKPVEVGPLVEEVQAWLSQSSAAQSAPFRTCFRLEPPSSSESGDQATQRQEETFITENKQDWLLSFHLQAKEDPSLLIPATQVWKNSATTLQFLQKRFENPQERLLADLGRASRIFPTLDRSLRTSHPSTLILDTTKAYDFLHQAAPLLIQSGFGVQVPSWQQKNQSRLSLKLKLKPVKQEQGKVNSGLLGFDTLVSYDWTIAVGDTIISAQEFARLVKLKVPLVQIRGQWVELPPEDIETALNFLQKAGNNQEIKLGEALQLGLGQTNSPDSQNNTLGLQISGLTGEDWLAKFLAQLRGDISLEQLPSPSTLQGTLRPYQERGFSWLVFLTNYGFGACLADDMGMGKTLQLIALLLHERTSENTPGAVAPTLLICPMSVVGNWERELARFSPSLRVLTHHGASRLAQEDFAREAGQVDLVLTTYALTHRDLAKLEEIKWQRIVLDEAQNIKNAAAKQTLAINKIKASQRVALTGTPVENRLSELWSIMNFLNPGYLGSATNFRQRFIVPIEVYRNPSSAEALKQLIQPFVLRRLKTDKAIIKDLPEKLEMKEYCNLTREQATLYQVVVEEMLAKVEEEDNRHGIKRKGLILATLLKLKQICNHPVQYLKDNSNLNSNNLNSNILNNRSGKLTRLVEMLEEVLAIGDKALIFTQFSEMGSLLRTYLQQQFDREVLYLYGATPKEQRDKMVERFQQKQGPPLFILSLKAGGVGLNLTAANHVFHFDRWWNPAVENQATDRAFRIGQQKNVQVHKFICEGTLEEHIDKLIEQKSLLADNVVGTGENWLTELSTAQLSEIFTLNSKFINSKSIEGDDES